MTLTPASGIPGTAVSLRGAGFEPRKPVVVKLRRRVLARIRSTGNGSFVAAATLPPGVNGRSQIVTATKKRSVVTLFQTAPLPRLSEASEIAAQSGARLREYPYQASAGTQITLTGVRFPRNRQVQITIGNRPLGGTRTNGQGGFSKQFAAPVLPPGLYRIVARAGPQRLALRFVLTLDPLIAAAGDIACDAESPNFNGGAGTEQDCHMRQTSDLILNLRPQGVLALGDTQYEAGTPVDYRLSYDPTWGRFKSITRPAIGNHEHGHQAGAGYWDYFGPLAGPRPAGYYSFDLGQWHLIALNDQCTEPAASCGVGSAQEKWLRADLAAHQNRCVLAYMHQPIFSSASGEGAQPLAQPFFNALYELGADVLLVSHAHNYERFAPQAPGGWLDSARGIRQFVVGTGGRDLQGFAGVSAPNSEVQNADTYGVLTLRLRSTSYDWRFVPEPGRTFSDAGSQACH